MLFAIVMLLFVYIARARIVRVWVTLIVRHPSPEVDANRDDVVIGLANTLPVCNLREYLTFSIYL